MNWLFGLFRRENVSVKVPVKEPETLEVKKNKKTVDVRDVTEKKCGYCGQVGHNIKTCVSMNSQMDEITSYFSKHENRMDIDGSKAYLLTIDKKVINRYLEKYKIRDYMYNKCSVYYDSNIKGTKGSELNMKLMIGYLCVVPLHPEIIIKRAQTHSEDCISMTCNDRSHDVYRHRGDGNLFGVRCLIGGTNTGLLAAAALGRR